MQPRLLRERQLGPSLFLAKQQVADFTWSGDVTRLNEGQPVLVQALAIPYGTTAHAQAYGRRNLVETGNSYFGGTYVDLSRTYSRLMGHTNRKFVLRMLLAGLNRYIERSWRAKQKPNPAPQPSTRPKRRRGTIRDLVPRAHAGGVGAGSTPCGTTAPMRT